MTYSNNFNENTRVKIPSLLTLVRLGFEYISLNDKNTKSAFHKQTNIFLTSFHSALKRLNPTIKQEHYSKILITFVEVKIPNNIQGIQAELERAKRRFSDESFKRYFNLTQMIVYSNNTEYNETELTPINGAFYSTSYNLKLNHFREELSHTLPTQDIAPLETNAIKQILKDTNTQAILNTPEFHTNTALDTPTNRLLISLFSHQRLMFFLRYGIAFVRDSHSIQKHIMRYPQFFATLTIQSKLHDWLKPHHETNTKDLNISHKRGIIWHTQGSGKTALSFYALRAIKDFYQAHSITTKFYFIVDRLDLLQQSYNEFKKRGLSVKAIESKQDFIQELQSLKCNNTEGRDEMIVVNIQKFSEDALSVPNVYHLKVQRIFFIDEAHRSYQPAAKFFTHLFNVDKEAIFLALTGTPLLQSAKREKSTHIFGDYIHKYYYDSSIKDGYTLRLIKEDIQSSYKASLNAAFETLKIEQGSLNASAIYAHKNFTTPLCEYIINDFATSRIKLGDNTIGAMVVCHSSQQAKSLYEISRSLSIDSRLKAAIAPPPRHKPHYK
ncbi:DEAD/DEAH box helicase family protein [uncultured Helicobacter sp.]|uniref:DEAD/DEAH box helicase family protein n=2 Tax=uncultured Helicobacter sp. TaxID=175537 RepID=UPI002610AA49|nr:DEAD/DEAH box helicase family protein [uncultured Helicobacter sp.]